MIRIRRYSKLMAIGLICLLWLILLPDRIMAAPRTVKVGYSEFTNFIEAQKDGSYTGYCVAYLNEIANYTDWKYQYVPCTWTESLEKLKTGEIDLVCSAQYTEERAKSYDYCRYSMGTESTILYVRPDDHSIYYNDYQAMNDKKVGMINGYYQNDAFAEYAKANGFTYTPVYYNDADLVKALEDKKVDMIVEGSLEYKNDLKAVGQFGSDPYYCITGKGKKDILDPLNQAMYQIKSNKNYLEGELYRKYYHQTAFSSSPAFTWADAAFISTCPTYTVGIYRDLNPISDSDIAGNFSGILVDIADTIAKKSGLKFRYATLPDDLPPAQALAQDKCDFVLGVDRSQAYMQDSQVVLTESLFSRNVVAVGRRNNKINLSEAHSVAYLKSNQLIHDMLVSTYPENELIAADTPSEALNKVVNGKADMAVLGNYLCNYFLQNPHYESLGVIATISYDDELAMLGKASLDNQLYSVINKSIENIGDAEIDSIVVDNTTSAVYQYTVADFLYKYRYTFAVFVLAAITLTLVLGSNAKHQRAAKVLQAESDTLREQVERDSLTGLYNKKTFYDKVRRRLDRRPKMDYAVISFDIDRFKVINELFGLEEGDALLVAIGKKLKAAFGRESIVAHFDGDDFFMLLPWDLEGKERFLEIYPGLLSGYPLDFNIILRCGVFPIREGERDTSVNLMCDRAHLASDEVKGSDITHIAIYDDDQRQTMLREQHIINGMERALEHHEFVVYFQPKFDPYDKRMTGSEALVRWNSPQEGLISPGDFIPVFEKNGFIVKLDTFVWEETCRCMKRWKEQGLPVLPVSVNMSRIHLYNNKLCAQIVEMVNQYGLTPSQFEIEVTESAYAENPVLFDNTLKELKAAGFPLLMDDFGSGYSSLNILKDLTVDVLKIDMRFMRNLEEEGKSGKLLASIVTMAHNLDLPVIVEGVETAEQLAFVKKIYGDQVQGFYFGRPMPPEEFEKCLARESKVTGIRQ